MTAKLWIDALLVGAFLGAIIAVVVMAMTYVYQVRKELVQADQNLEINRAKLELKEREIALLEGTRRTQILEEYKGKFPSRTEDPDKVSKERAAMHQAAFPGREL